MRDRTNDIEMLNDTLEIFGRGYYEKNGKKIALKLSTKEAEEVQVFLPDEVAENASRKDIDPRFVSGGRCVYSCENKDSFSLARERLGDSHEPCKPRESRRGRKARIQGAGGGPMQKEFAALIAGEQSRMEILQLQQESEHAYGV